jgi:hypothetical protein
MPDDARFPFTTAWAEALVIDVRGLGDRILAPTPTESLLAAHYLMIYSLSPKNARGISRCGCVPYSCA